MKRLVLAMALAGVLTVPALAGDIPTVDFTPPPPPPEQRTASTQQSVPGNIPTADSPATDSFEALVILIAQLMAR